MDKGLTRTGNFSKSTSGAPSIANIRQEIDNGHPLCLRIGWSGGGGHAILANGYNRDFNMVAVADPWYGSSDVSLPSLQSAYQGSGSCTDQYYVKP